MGRQVKLVTMFTRETVAKTTIQQGYGKPSDIDNVVYRMGDKYLITDTTVRVQYSIDSHELNAKILFETIEFRSGFNEVSERLQEFLALEGSLEVTLMTANGHRSTLSNVFCYNLGDTLSDLYTKEDPCTLRIMEDDSGIYLEVQHGQTWSGDKYRPGKVLKDKLYFEQLKELI